MHQDDLQDQEVNSRETIPIEKLADFAAKNSTVPKRTAKTQSSTNQRIRLADATTNTRLAQNTSVKSNTTINPSRSTFTQAKPTEIVVPVDKTSKPSTVPSVTQDLESLAAQVQAAKSHIQEPGDITRAKAEAKAKAEAEEKAKAQQAQKEGQTKKTSSKKKKKAKSSSQTVKESSEKKQTSKKSTKKNKKKGKEATPKEEKVEFEVIQPNAPKEKKPPNPILVKTGKVIWTLLKAPGTYALIIVIFAIGAFLMKMFQLSLFKVSLAGLILGIALVVMSLAGYWFFLTSHKFWQVPAMLLCVALVGCSFYGQRELTSFSAMLETICKPGATFIQSVGLYAPTLIPINDLNTLNGETLGIMENRDTAAVNALLDDLLAQGIHVKTKAYNSLQQLYKAVRGQAIRAVILNPGDVKLIEEFAGVGQSSTQLSAVYRVPVNTEVSTPISPKNLDTEPYTVLISGSNSLLKEASYRSNLNLVVTVNPNTQEILTIVVPKSLYLSSNCVEGLACPPVTSPDRLSFMSYHSIEALRETLENFFQTTIDFTVRLDMDKLLLLYDQDENLALSTDVPYTDVNGGNKALISSPLIKRFLGNVDDPSSDDMNQELNQLRILLTLSHAYQNITPFKLEDLLPNLDLCISTSFTYDQLCQIVKMFYIFPEAMTNYYQLITGTSSIEYSPTLTEATYMTTPDPVNVEQARNAIKAVLAGTPPDTNGLPDPSIFNPAPAPETPVVPEEQPETEAEVEAEGEVSQEEEDYYYDE